MGKLFRASAGSAGLPRQVIPAFFIDRDAKFTLLFSHGNAEDLGMIIQYFRNWSASLDQQLPGRSWYSRPGPLIQCDARGQFGNR